MSKLCLPGDSSTIIWLVPVTEQLVQDAPPVVRGELALPEDVGLGGVDEGVLHGLGLDVHAVGDDDVLEARFLTDVVVLLSQFSLDSINGG